MVWDRVQECAWLFCIRLGVEIQGQEPAGGLGAVIVCNTFLQPEPVVLCCVQAFSDVLQLPPYSLVALEAAVCPGPSLPRRAAPGVPMLGAEGAAEKGVPVAGGVHLQSMCCRSAQELCKRADSCDARYAQLLFPACHCR